MASKTVIKSSLRSYDGFKLNKIPNFIHPETISILNLSNTPLNSFEGMKTMENLET